MKNKILALVASLDSEKTNNYENLNAAEIQSDTQLNNKIFVKAEGNVLVNYKNMILKADKLEYNRKNKTLIVEGAIKFKSNDQFFEATFLKYDLKNKVGFIENIYGSINFDTLGNIASASNRNPEINKNQFQKSDESIKNIKLNKSSIIGFDGFKLDSKDESLIAKLSPQSFLLLLLTTTTYINI